MTNADSGVVLVPDAQVREPAGRGGTDAVSVVDTTELRWFFVGSLPPDVREWFCGSSGVAEERCDAYLFDGRGHIGVKRRFGKTLELKVRQSLDEPLELGEGLSGPTEAWRKWSPADGVVGDVRGGRWVDVHKSIVKRRFSVQGTEVEFSPYVTRAGCDIEVADVTVGAVHRWTLALAGFGPIATRRHALFASWQALVTSTPCPDHFGPATGPAMGYPEWLALTVSSDLAVAW